MATLFGVVTSLVAMGQRADIGDAQRTWLKGTQRLRGRPRMHRARISIPYRRAVG
jgi:hypothetical protein